MSTPRRWRSMLACLVAVNLAAALFAVSPASAVEGVHMIDISDVSAPEGNGGTSFNFTVSLNLPSPTAIEVDVRTIDGTAQSTTIGASAPDFTAVPTTTLVFAPGQTSKTVTVIVQGDTNAEPSERFSVVLENAKNATIRDNSALGTITNDDAAPVTLSVGDAPVSESAGTATFTITQSAISNQDSRVGYRTTNGSATAGSDYTGQSGIATVPAGSTTTTVVIPITSDTVDESDETFTVDLDTEAANATVADPSGAGTITDDDATPVISITNETVTEGGAADFDVTISNASDRTITVQVDTEDGTAVAEDDYASKSTTVTFPAGTTAAQHVVVQTAQDDLDEANEETFTVVLSGPTNATCTGGDCEGAGTITDDDPLPIITIANDSATEGADGNLVFPMTLSNPSGGPVTVSYATSDGTAKAPADYTAATATLTIPSGEDTAEITIPINNDTADELDNETMTVNLSSPVGATCTGGTCTAIGTISDNDAAPTVSINDGQGSEPATPVAFTVTLSAASERDITVTYSTTDGTADADGDYTPVPNGSVTFSPGHTTEPVSITVLDDADVEGAEDFLVTILGPNGCTGGDCTGTGTILDDESPILTIDDSAATEADGVTTTPMPFTIRTSVASANDITVDFATANGTADDNEDYDGQTGTATILAGQLTATIDIDVLPDNFAEPSEHFFVNLSNAQGADIADAQARGTITDDDAGTPASLSIADKSVTEGSSGTATMNFTVTKAQPNPATTQTVTVEYRTRPTTPAQAVAGEDYSAATGTVTFGPADTSKTIAITVTSDTVDEVDEQFEVELFDASNATISDGVAVGTIDDDDGPTISVANAPDVVEADAPMPFVLTLSAPSPQEITVLFSTNGGTATAGSDYTAKTNFLVTFPAQSTEQTVDVTIKADAVDEANETVDVQLATPTNATIADGTATGTITDNDGPTISISDPTAVLEEEGATVSFTVTLSAASPQEVTVKARTSDGAAKAGSDFTGRALTTITFAPTDTSESFDVLLKEDELDEIDEQFTVELSAPTNATILDASGTGTITDDDATPTLSINDVTVTEGNGPGTVAAVFGVVLSAASGRDVTVQAASIDGGTATPGVDYTTLAPTTLTIPAGSTTASATVAVTGDRRDEANETFLVGLTAPNAATLADDTATGTITDDDPTPTIGILDVTVTEGNTGTVNAAVVVTLSSESASTVTVQAATANGTAGQPGDYTAVGPVTVTFTPGTQSQTVNVPVNGDLLDESDETFSVVLSNPSGGHAIADDKATVTITDDDSAPTVSIGDASVTEGTAAGFTVTLSAPSGRTVTVGYATADGTAVQPADYTAASGTLTFAPGETSKTVSVTTAGDSSAEPEETASVTLSDPTNATIADGSGTLTIADDDQAAQGYSLVGEDGSLYAFGTATNAGDMRGTKLNAPIIGVAYTPGGKGYWLVAKDGGIFTFGDAQFFGSMGGTKLNSPIIGMAATPTGQGYWLFAGDGGIFTFGDAQFFGSMGDQKLNAPVINMEPLKSGKGYWLVAADGGIFTFGEAKFFGSMGSAKLNQPVFDMTSTDTDGGYWLVARDGGIFSFGDAEAKFFGSAVNESVKPTKIIGMDSTPDSQGYWIADASGRIYRYGDAQDLGGRAGANNPAPMVAFAAVRAANLR